MIKNFRELAYQMKNNQGKTIKKHMIFRSGELTFADKKDISLLEDYQIKKIYDLRSLGEREQSSINHTIEVKGFDVTNSKASAKMDNAFLEKVAPNANGFMLMLYQDYLAFSPILKPLFQEIINERNPFLFHCAAGKDRTGVVGTLILAILGFTENQMIDEYNKLDPRVITGAEDGLRKQGLSEELIKQLRPLNGVDPIFIQGFIDAIKHRYQTLDCYLKEYLELTDEKITAFQNNYLE